MTSNRRKLLPLIALVTLGAARPETAASHRAAEPAQAGPIRIERINRPTDILRGVVARIDLTDPAVRVRVVPAGGGGVKKGSWPTTLAPVSAAAAREGFELAVNGDYFAIAATDDAGAGGKYAPGRPATPLGNTVTDGVRWSRAPKAVPMLVITERGDARIESAARPGADAFQVVSGNLPLIENGRVLRVHDEKDLRAPRTAVGLSEDRHTLILLVIDGRSFTSRGQTLGELASEMKALGAHNAFNLDGGGSSTFVHREDGLPKVLNRPSEGTERPIANVLGIALKPEK